MFCGRVPHDQVCKKTKKKTKTTYALCSAVRAVGSQVMLLWLPANIMISKAAMGLSTTTCLILGLKLASCGESPRLIVVLCGHLTTKGVNDWWSSSTHSQCTQPVAEARLLFQRVTMDVLHSKWIRWRFDFRTDRCSCDPPSGLLRAVGQHRCAWTVCLSGLHKYKQVIGYYAR